MYLNSGYYNISNPLINLTLTRVVFEYVLIYYWFRFYIYLTLTRVVFEFATIALAKNLVTNLTLTRVVFEWK